MTPFDKIAGKWAHDLCADLGLSLNQACGILGNLGFESGGFQLMQELAPVAGGRGGYGCAQWTGPRRVAFENWCRARSVSTDSDAGNYGYLVTELKSTYASCLRTLMMENTLDRCVFVFGRDYEAPEGTTRTHLPGFDGRLTWAKKAFALAQGTVATIPPAPAKPVPMKATPEQVQQRLVDLGWDIQVDGLLGPQSCGAIMAALNANHA